MANNFKIHFSQALIDYENICATAMYHTQCMEQKSVNATCRGIRM